MAETPKFSISDAAEFWIVDNYKVYAVFTVPGSAPPIHLAWHIPTDADFQSMLGPDQPVRYDRKITAAQFKGSGALLFGTTNDLANFDDDPFSSWAHTMDTQAAVQPWIMDRDYQGLIAMAMLEGRALTDAEVQGTTWWKTHSSGEREWMKLWHGDRKTANDRLADNRIRTLQTLKEAGIQSPSAKLVNAMADAVTKGTWTTAKFQQQVQAVADPFSGVTIDALIASLVTGTTGTTREGELDVGDLVRQWLGPMHGQWADKDIARWAGRLRNDPDAETELIEHLRKQRMALFPTYTDEHMTYDDIAAPWRSMVMNTWGVTADETDPMFLDLIKNNDTTLNSQILRQKGLAKGVGKVVQDAQASLLGVGGGSVRRPVQ